MRPHEERSAAVNGRTAEETLRLIATAPAPDGLVSRIQSELRSAPAKPRGAMWRPGALPAGWWHSDGLRGLAAAVIVCMVAGGGWGIYSRVLPEPAADVSIVPPRTTGNGFSTAGGRIRPDTLNGPVLTHEVPAVSTDAAPTADLKEAEGKAVTSGVQDGLRRKSRHLHSKEARHAPPRR